jgi:hypothetical protein
MRYAYAFSEGAVHDRNISAGEELSLNRQR